jgi:hypothetical protein
MGGIVIATVASLFISLRGICRGIALTYLVDRIVVASGLRIGHCLR